jgi:hypothetical protein
MAATAAEKDSSSWLSSGAIRAASLTGATGRRDILGLDAADAGEVAERTMGILLAVRRNPGVGVTSGKRGPR